MTFRQHNDIIPLSGPRRDVFFTAVQLMGNTEWKNTVAPAHDHTLGSELGMTEFPDGRRVLTRLVNCPRCGEAAADRFWPLACAEAAARLGIPWTLERVS